MSLLILTDEKKKELSNVASLIALARLPYKFGAKPNPKIDPERLARQNEPSDCSGMTKYLLYQVGYEIPDGSINQFEASEPIEDKDIITGDLIFKKTFDTGIIEHVGIYIGNSLIVEAEGWYGMTIRRPFSSFKTCNPKAAQYAGARRLMLEKIKTI